MLNKNMSYKKLTLLYFLTIAFIACNNESDKETLSGLSYKNFQTEKNDKPTNLYTLTNKNGMEVCITNYGARVVAIMVPDRDGVFEDVVYGFPTVQEYMNIKQNFGATIGRYIGRIRNATFVLDNQEYKLVPNKDNHIAHGGDPGFADNIWEAKQMGENSAHFTYLSQDRENGFPGNLTVKVIYTVTDNNELDIRYEAMTDAPTVINLSNHSFFNISGDLMTTVENQILYVNADYFTPYDSTKCVSGEIRPVINTPFDFNTPTEIGKRHNLHDEQLLITGGYDHTFVLNTKGDDKQLAAKLYDPVSGRTLEVYTTEPGMQVYTGNGLKGKMVGKNGVAYPKRSSICLETMHFQDSPNQPHFPSTVLRPGETFNSHTVFRFGVEK